MGDARKRTAAKRGAKKGVKAVGKTVVAKSSATPAMSDEMNGHVRVIRELAAIVERRSLTELILDLPEATITLRRGDTAVPMVQHVQPAMPMMPHMAPAAEGPAHAVADEPAGGAEAEAAANGEHHLVTSPFVGTFYRRPSPDADAYVSVGQSVQKGDILCIVEAMKLMNEIEADASGVIAAVLVEDGQPVEYGQALFKITPS